MDALTPYLHLATRAVNKAVRPARRRLEAEPWWQAVPALRLKDLTGAPSGDGAGGRMALTFDDGPDPDATPRVLRALEAHGAKATFFMCGVPARRHPDLVRAVADAGHVVGGHGWDHRFVRWLDDGEWRRQVDDTHALLEDLTGRPVRHFRPPWAIYDRLTLRRLWERGVATVLWSSEGEDWVDHDAATIARRVTRNLGPDGIVLLHDACGALHRLPPESPPPPGLHTSRRATADAVGPVLAWAAERNLVPVPLPPPPASGAPQPAFGRPARSGR